MASSLGAEADVEIEEDPEALEAILPGSQGATARNTYFEVMAGDMLSAQYVATTGEMFARRFSRMVPVPAGVRKPILVDLVPVGERRMGSPSLTRIHPSGHVDVSISWGAETSRARMERALVQGHLTYLSGAYSAGGVDVPLWLELAGQHLARVQAVPAHGRHLARQVADVGPMRMETIFAAQREDKMDDELAPHAYWLLLFLEREGRSRGQLQNFLIRVLRGEDPMEAVRITYGEQLRSAADGHVWWLVGVNELIRNPESPMPTAEESRRRVKDLSGFVFETGGRQVRLFGEDLWEYRESSRLQGELRRRVTAARMELAAVHPFYHNALLSLERLFQAVLATDEEEYREAVVALRHDFRTGDEMSDDVRSVLDDLAEEIGS